MAASQHSFASTTLKIAFTDIRFNTDALVFLSKLRMPLLTCDSSKDIFFSLYLTQDSKRMSIERKYDGKYCQVHIDLARRTQRTQNFSKSGKDSTSDRE